MLDLYKASAGAGKTHRLTGIYIKLLFSKEKAYKHILAVTFTNKATEEMKERILDELFKISEGKGDAQYLSWIRDLDRFVHPSTEMQKRIAEAGGMDGFIASEARKIMIDILHDYSSFMVTTIDKFFQLVLRAFSREIGQYSSYTVELDTDPLPQIAVDNMYDSLGEEENQELLEWLTEYSLAEVEAGNSWNVRKALYDFGQVIFKEEFIKSKGFSNVDAEDRSKVKAFKDHISKIVDSYRTEVKALATRFVDIVSSGKVEFSDFKGGSRTPFNEIQKIADGKLYRVEKTLKFLSPGEEWVTKSSKSAGSQLIKNELQPALYEALSALAAYCQDHYSLYSSAEVVEKNIYKSSLLADIALRVNAYLKENNEVLLSQSTEVLNGIISDSDAPFVYEKIGTWIENFMLDEFQDTSAMQWSNFRSLLVNSMSENHENLIVGDVKQSIYRFRGSDCSILGEKVGEELGYLGVKESTLNDNWRSLPSVVDFNNECFGGSAASVTAQWADAFHEAFCESGELEAAAGRRRILDSYEDVRQNVPEKRRSKLPADSGFVQVRFFEGKSAEWKEAAMNAAGDLVQTFRDRGYDCGDICFLVRSNAEVSMISSKLLDLGYSVVSDLSLMVSSSRLIDKIVNILKVSSDPDNILAKTGKIEHVDVNMSLYELCRTLVDREVEGNEELRRSESAFISCFLDMALDFSVNKGSDLSAFLKWWDESGKNTSISAPKDRNAISVMTIHKSKGLGFKCCVLPFFDLGMHLEKDDILCDLDHYEGFEGGGVIPMKAKESLSDTVFSDKYRTEALASYLENLNLAYVSFTRAKDALVIYSPVFSGKKKKSISACLYECVTGVDSFAGLKKVEDNYYEKGVLYDVVPETEEGSGCEGREISYVSSPAGDRLKLSLRSYELFEEGDMRKKGLLMHSILQSVSSVEDVDQVCGDFVANGELAPEDLESVSLKLKTAIASVASRRWFDLAEGDRLLNERDIILPDGSFKRPDRVIIRSDGSVEIIDYKFGMEKNAAYVKQIGNYAELFRRMGYARVSASLWYVELEEVECH